MTCLLKTDIEKKIKSYIQSNIARIGGTVNQIVDYSQCCVTDINLLDGGYGSVDQLDNKQSFLQRASTIRKTVSQEIKFCRYGEKIPRDRKTVLLDAHNISQHPRLYQKYSCCISSNVIEHSPNPILLLLNFHLLCPENGYQFHALPHYKYTYDCFREPTDVKHLIEDFKKRTGFDDETHNDDYIQSAIIKHGWQKQFHKTHPVSYPYIHFHVFDEHNTRELFETIFTDVTLDIYKTEEFSDIVVLFRNQLNSQFRNKYQRLIDDSFTCAGKL